MRKLWLVGGAAVVIAGAAAFVMLSGATSLTGSAKKEDKPVATLEFTSGHEGIHRRRKRAGKSAKNDGCFLGRRAIT